MSKGNMRLSDYVTEGALRGTVERALEEDLGRGDVTSDLLVPSSVAARGVLRSRSQGVIAGLELAATPDFVRNG